LDPGYIEKIKESIISFGSGITEEKEIPYGLQIKTTSGTVRIYQNKKGKTTLDLSQLKDENLKGVLSGDTSAPLLSPPLLGSDEAGKGDWFGPLVVACVYADEKMYSALSGLGVRDSKELSDRKIEELKEKIVAVCPVYSVIELSPEKYNAMYEKAGNINTILAGAHAAAVRSVMERSGCKRVLIDQFTTEERMKNALAGSGALLTQAHRAEENMAVAAASILARYVYRKRLTELSEAFGVTLFAGGGAAADEAAAEFLRINGAEALGKAAKLHFRNTERILGNGSLREEDK